MVLFFFLPIGYTNLLFCDFSVSEKFPLITHYNWNPQAHVNLVAYTYSLYVRKGDWNMMVSQEA